MASKLQNSQSDATDHSNTTEASFFVCRDVTDIPSPEFVLPELDEMQFEYEEQKQEQDHKKDDS